MIAGYLTVDAYEEFHRWLGRAEQLGELWRLWAAGDRRAAVAGVRTRWPTRWCCMASGTLPEQMRAYVEAGVQLPVLAVLPGPQPLDVAGWHDVLAELGGS